MSNGLSKPKERPLPAKLPDPERKKLLCVNCTHHSTIDPGTLLPMAHACNVEKLFDQVDGKPIYRKCSYARTRQDICGPYAEKFEPKP